MCPPKEAPYLADTLIKRISVIGCRYMAENQEDLALVEAAKNGDHGAFDQLVEKYQIKICKMVTRYVHEPSEAADVTQEAFIKAYNALDSFRGDSAFFTWLYRIAINCAKNSIQQRNRRMEDVDIDSFELESTISSANLKDFTTPEGILMQNEFEDEIYTAIKDLPRELRTAIMLRELEGLSYDEIAGVMVCPIGTVRSRIHRAREAIERHMRDHGS